ncbi:GNAT family N-acetyltransferase [Fibrella aquatilis]|uniref:GNAT family N-acetyltransferase n=1 Tax=Fibrella aquatilis TaxID=2817059 RepID=A0A939GCH6_9BACT|nr:GNAT family N-acetyltransferase [Fibrella aquatilis]MBO0934724.1 GNAT family N-acetyltransferase [Fibrella aquatilis]
MVERLLVKWLTREITNDAAWNGCVAGAHNALVYGYTWYLDAVTSTPGWRWEGLVVEHESGGGYAVVMPVPLRKRWGRWVVYQPLFCQFLAIFSQEPLDVAPFINAVYDRYRYASKWQLLLAEPMPGLPTLVRQQVRHTHVLGVGGSQSEQPAYTTYRQKHLHRATNRSAAVSGWRVDESMDLEPLLTLFRENHADEIGVGDWAYDLLRALFRAAAPRGLASLQYVWAGGQVVAGALFLAQHDRIIYLVNAANAEGRRLDARSLLLDKLIQAERKKATDLPLLLDFESPDKQAIINYYESFGATAQPYLLLNWSRLTWLERGVQGVKFRP